MNHNNSINTKARLEVHAMIKGIVDNQDIKYDTDLIGEGIIDSLNLLEMILRIEKEFFIKISISDFFKGHLESIHTIAELIIKRRGDAHGK